MKQYDFFELHQTVKDALEQVHFGTNVKERESCKRVDYFLQGCEDTLNGQIMTIYEYNKNWGIKWSYEFAFQNCFYIMNYDNGEFYGSEYSDGTTRRISVNTFLNTFKNFATAFKMQYDLLQELKKI